MQLFYCPTITEGKGILPEQEAIHALRVLRLTTGDTIHVTDGKGGLYRCTIIASSKKDCVFQVDQALDDTQARDYKIIMAVAPTKNIDRYEWFLEKATEVGCDEFIPMVSEHSERKIVKNERLEKVILSAVKQSLKATLPLLHELTPLKDVINMKFDGRKFIAHCDTPLKEKRFLGSTLKKGENALVLIGPEGDFSSEEIALAVNNGFEEISLGRMRLRDETAAIMASVIVSTINQMD